MMFHRMALIAIISSIALLSPSLASIGSGSEPVAPDAKVTVGPWRYEFTLRAWGTRSEGGWGALTFEGKELTTETLPGIGVNDYVHSPWGTLYWHGVSKFAWGPHGWFPSPTKGNAGKRVVPANAPPNECLLAEADDGTTVHVAVKTRITVRAFGAWELLKRSDEVLTSTSQPIHRNSPLPPGWGAGPSVQFSFLAERPGTTTLEFTQRPAASDAASRPKTLRVTVVVAASD